MKKLNLIFGMMLISCMLNAQSDWNESGNTGTNSSTDFVGTTDPEDLSFRTDNTIKMQLESTGELGLGITNPASWFHVLTNGSGTVAASEVFRTDVPAMTATNWRIFRAGTEYFQLNVASSGNGVFLHSRRGDFHIASGNSGTPIPSFQIRGGSGGDAGNLGFGDYTTLTSPQALLHLYKSASVDFQMTNSVTGNTNVDGFRIIVDTTRAVSLYNWEDYDIFFGTGDVGAGGALTNRMVIRGGTNYGRVGVGTNSPGSQLDVFDNTDISSAGDDIAFKAYEQLALTNTVNRAVATVIHAEEGTTTIGSEITVDSYNTVNTNKQMVGVFTGIRGTDASGYVSDAIGYRAFVDYSDNYAIRKYGIQALVGHATPSNTANTYGGYFAAQSAYGNNYGGYFVASASTGNEYGV